MTLKGLGKLQCGGTQTSILLFQTPWNDKGKSFSLSIPIQLRLVLSFSKDALDLMRVSKNDLAMLFVGATAFFLVTCGVIVTFIEDMDDTPTRPQSQSPRLSRIHKQKTDANYYQKMLRYGGIRSNRRPLPESSRAHYDLDLDPERINSMVRRLRTLDDSPLTTVDESLHYSIERCPDDIPEGYPLQWSLVHVLSHWNPDDTEIPQKIYQGLCSLDWKDPRQRELAQAYREAEVPFLIKNHPEVWQTAERWTHYDYLDHLLGGEATMYRNEHSHGNHMPYWKLGKNQPHPPGWKPPTENVDLSFPEWYKKAAELEGDQHVDTVGAITKAEHWYFRLNGAWGSNNDFLYDELPIFSPTEPSFFMPDPEGQRGINCRFGSKGIIAETHYDMSRNFILILRGHKRYILAHPDQCPNLELHPVGHPSARHSKVNWSDPSEWQTGNFAQAQANEVVLQAGDVLYLPTAWFHFIVSLDLNYQCNARSGATYESEKAIHDCGFLTNRM